MNAPPLKPEPTGHRVQPYVCVLCREGAGGECRSRGCAYARDLATSKTNVARVPAPPFGAGRTPGAGYELHGKHDPGAERAARADSPTPRPQDVATVLIPRPNIW